MKNFELLQDLQDRERKIGSIDRCLGKGLSQPFNPSVSGSRKILSNIQDEHHVYILGAEPSIISTGYDDKAGEYNSCFIRADRVMTIVEKIKKFEWSDLYYIVIVSYINDDGILEFGMIERIEHRYTNETFGFPYDNSYIDSIDYDGIETKYIQQGEVIKKSKSYSNTNRRQNGAHLNAVYLCLEKNKEDSAIFSEDASEKFSTYKYSKCDVIINDNDIPLNIYGDKTFPDIGESVKDGLLMVVRRCKNDEALYTLNKDMLSTILMSDETYIAKDIVYDINIMCNDPSLLHDPSNPNYFQLYKYYLATYEFYQKIVDLIDGIKQDYCDRDYTISPELDQLWYNAKEYLSGAKFTTDRRKTFSNVIISFSLVQKKKMEIGDKFTNRYGGKGVVSHIYPNEWMPYDPITGERADVIINSNSCVSRKNPAQMFELHLNSANVQLVKWLKDKMYNNEITEDECIYHISDFVSIISSELGKWIKDMYYDKVSLEYLLKQNIACLNEMEQRYLNTVGVSTSKYLQDVFDSGYIKLSINPASENMNITKLMEIYKRFPFIRDRKLMMPMPDSNGNMRMVNSRRAVPFGKIYFYRLKQHSDDKFSVCSLSSTNIRSLNMKSRKFKEYKTPYSKTPIQYGYMESYDIAIIGMDALIRILMLHSVSPQARRQIKNALHGDPYNLDVNLDDLSVNRNVEILNAYMKTKGLKFVFVRKKIKQKQAIMLDYDLISENALTRNAMMVTNNQDILSKDYLDNLEKEFVKSHEIAKGRKIIFSAIRPIEGDDDNENDRGDTD